MRSPHRSASGVPDPNSRLGDFTMAADGLRLVPLALVIGVIATVIAVVLLDLIGLVTNISYFGRLDTSLASPAQSPLGPIVAVVPVIGGLVIGVMARYGSERIRGHGIPEAMETILIGGSKVEPKLAVLKPISSAVSIGTGGPFGAEGPIIMTGGAFGSLVAQFVRLSASERKTLLVAGAAAGMTAVFGTPVASVIFAVELLLFEWKPRSLVPVAAASALAMAIRLQLADAGLIAPVPLFPVPDHPMLGAAGLASAFLIGVVGGGVAWLLTVAVYGAEDGFMAIGRRTGGHWMWWPALGGVVVGIGGLVDPHALGVGYDAIRAELAGEMVASALLSLFVVKLVIWAVALGSGTSGGILAPVLMMGGAIGGLLAPILPGGSVAVFSLLGMSAALAGVTRSPFTGVIFAIELTHDQNALLPLLIACVTAYAVSVLVLRRSILTEKVARRGFHVMREYAVDPLEALFVRDVMTTNVLTVPAAQPIAELAAVADRPEHRRQRLYPVLDESRLVGILGLSDIERALGAHELAPDATVANVMHTDMLVAMDDDTLRSAADDMSAARIRMMPVVARDRPDALVGLLSQFDLLRARERLIVEERHRERVLRMRFVPTRRRWMERRRRRGERRLEPVAAPPDARQDATDDGDARGA
jgi:chloride channel protein, CIC family